MISKNVLDIFLNVCHTTHMNETLEPPVNPHDAFIDALPDDAYGLCPCGCGKKLKFVAQEKPVDVETHFFRFVQQMPNYTMIASV